MNLSANSLPIIALMLMGLILLAGFIRIRSTHLRRARQRRGIDWLDKLRRLLAHLQQHRGMSSGYLAGNLALLRDLEQLHQLIRRDIDEIGAVDDWILQNSRWSGIEEHWQRLSQRFKTLERDDNINQHNRMLTNLIYLIEDTADAHDLKALYENDAQGQRVWRDLLVAAEHIGQARAIGTAITAAGNCDSVSRIQMSYLSNKIEDTCLNLWGNLNIPHQAQHKLQDLLQCIKYRVMQDTPQIESKIFFNLASGCLEEILSHYDREILALRERVH